MINRLNSLDLQHSPAQVRRDLLDMALPQTPMILHWKASADTSPVASLVNTPPVFAIYACGHVLKGLRRSFGDCGTLETVRQRVTRRADDVYKIIDRSEGFYINKATCPLDFGSCF
eukprot:g14151.t1